METIDVIFFGLIAILPITFFSWQTSKIKSSFVDGEDSGKQYAETVIKNINEVSKNSSSEYFNGFLHAMKDYLEKQAKDK